MSRSRTLVCTPAAIAGARDPARASAESSGTRNSGTSTCALSSSLGIDERADRVRHHLARAVEHAQIDELGPDHTAVDL